MDTSQAQNLIGWFLGVLGIGVISIITGIYSVIKVSKMIPREVRGADLDNLSKEISIADQFDELATKAADKAIKAQTRVDELEKKYCEMEEDFKEQKVLLSNLSARSEEQDILIAEQAAVIEEQSKRLDLQDKKISEQEEEINLLHYELSNSNAYNLALIQQMKEQHIIPIEESAVIKNDYEKSNRKKREFKNDK